MKPVVRPRLLYLSVLNVLACFAVVMLHCTNAAFWNYANTKTWVTGNLVETLFYFAVPIFFMISGATLVDYHERYSDRVFLKKRFLKTVVPFLFWSIVAYVYWAFTYNGGVLYRNPLRIASEMLNSDYIRVYWFFLPLFAIYLAMPIITRIQDKLKVFSYAIWLGLIFVVILPFLFNLLELPYNELLTPPPVAGYMIYVFLGYTLSRVQLARRQKLVVYVCGVLGWAMHFFGTWILSVQAGMLVQTFKGYLNLPCVMMAIAVFVAVREFDFMKLARRIHLPRVKIVRYKNRFERVINWLAGTTFGVYLIHVYVIYYLPAILGFSATSWVWRTFGAVAVFLGCAVVVKLLQKVPLVRKIVP